MAAQRRRALQDYAFLCPQLLLYVGFTLVPFLVAVPILLTDRLNFQDTSVESVGLANFARIFTDPGVAQDYWPALSRTVRFTLLNYLMVYVFGLTLALMLYEIGTRNWFFTIIYLPMMASGLAVGYIANMLFSQSTGTLNLLLQALGMVEQPIDIKSPAGTTILLPILVGWRQVGFNMAIFLAGLLSVPAETVEAAIVDGTSYWQRLTRAGSGSPVCFSPR